MSTAGRDSRVRVARLAGASVIALAVTVTGWLLWRGFQPMLHGDVRRDLFLDAAHVRLISGLPDIDALITRLDEKGTNPDRDAISLPVTRNCALEWDVDCRPGTFRMDVARLVVGPAADNTPCTITVSVFTGDAGAAPLQQVMVTPPPCPELPGASALWREGPSVPLALGLPQGARSLRIEVRSPTEGAERVPDGAAVALLSPRVEQVPLDTPLADARRAVLLEERLLPRVPVVAEGAQGVLFATRRSADALAPVDVRQPPVQAVAAFTGKEGRPAVAFTGESAVEWTVDVQPDSVLRGAVALDIRLPPGTRAKLEVRVDDALVATEVVDGAHWRELSVPLGEHAGLGRRLKCALVAPELQPAEVVHEDADFVLGDMVQRAYTAKLVSAGLADPRLVRTSEVPVRRATSGRPAVILIQVETLRADALGKLLAADGGAPASCTPNLDAFAARSTVWTSAFTPAPWTLPTTVSVLTGLLPSAHGAVDHDRLVVPGDAPTLAELASRAGVATGAVVASELLRPQAGFARGFDTYAAVPYVNARQVNDLAGAFLANHAGEQFLLFLHYFDPHSTYAAPGDWRERFVDADLRGEDMHAVEARVVDELKRATAEGRVPAPAERDVRFLRQRYAGEVAWFDSQFRALQDTLVRLGLDGSTVVVLTSDHGEEFFEHGLWGHGSQLYDESLHVPLIVSGPRGLPGLSLSGTRLTTPVSTVGLFASVLRWLDVPFAADSVRPPLDAPLPAVYSETSKGIALTGGRDPLRRHLHSVRSADHRLNWRQPIDEEKGPGERQLFDLKADAAELHPLPVEGAPGNQLWDRLLQDIEWSRQHKVAAPLPGGDSELVDTINALGYAGGAPGTPTKGDGTAAAPAAEAVGRIGKILAARSDLPDCSEWSSLSFAKYGIAVNVPACWYVASTPEARLALAAPKTGDEWLAAYLRLFQCAGSPQEMLLQSGGDVFGDIAAPGWLEGVAINKANILMRAWVTKADVAKEAWAAAIQARLATALTGLAGIDEPVIDAAVERHGDRDWSVVRLLARGRFADYDTMLTCVACATPCRDGLLLLVFCGRSGSDEFTKTMPGILERVVIDP